MATIPEMKRRVESIRLRERVPEIIQSNAAELIDYNQKQMFERGQKANNEPIGYYNSIPYALQKNQMNPKPGMMRVDLKLTGAFYRGMWLSVDRTSFELDSRDSKASKLKSKYGDTIFGLSDENKAEYSKGSLFNGIKRHIEDKTGLEFK